jgi:hypothetical protein
MQNVQDGFFSLLLHVFFLHCMSLELVQNVTTAHPEKVLVLYASKKEGCYLSIDGNDDVVLSVCKKNVAHSCQKEIQNWHPATRC